jgi:uncharacterized protein YrrD
MLLMSKSLLNRPVMSLRSGGQIATTIEPAINPHNLKILGWWCRVTGQNNQQVLLADDVREIMPRGLAINDDSDLSTPEELVRHREILNVHFQLIDKVVKTKRHKLGKVSDYAYDQDSMFIEKLYVMRPLVKLFASDDTLIIGRNQIVEITDKYILVKDADVTVAEEEPEEEVSSAAEAVPST